MSVVAIDIGGANLKASDGSKSASRPLALWKEPQKLASELASLLTEFHPYGPVVITMTGELADCFQTRAEGVSAILLAVQEAAARRQIYVWQTGGEFFNIEEAVEFPELVAAANWHALASWAGRACPAGMAMLIDIGSTTTDIIPIDAGTPVPQGRTDLTRLCHGELVYHGVRRTPLCAITDHVEVNGADCRLASELFATTLDIALLLDDIPEQNDNFDTANSRAATRLEASHRLARMLCSDCDQISEVEINKLAEQFRSRQLEILAGSLHSVVDSHEQRPEMLILSGEGEYLARKLLDQHFPDLLDLETISLNQTLSYEHSQSACAYALAILGKERI